MISSGYIIFPKFHSAEKLYFKYIIDSICNRLELEDHLAWNMERRLMTEKYINLNMFGEWLTNRAEAY